MKSHILAEVLLHVLDISKSLIPQVEELEEHDHSGFHHELYVQLYEYIPKK